MPRTEDDKFSSKKIKSANRNIIYLSSSGRLHKKGLKLTGHDVGKLQFHA
jgi:hypothetical protein